jgi:hypothetical protein
MSKLEEDDACLIKESKHQVFVRPGADCQQEYFNRVKTKLNIACVSKSVIQEYVRDNLMAHMSQI